MMKVRELIHDLIKEKELNIDNIEPTSFDTEDSTQATFWKALLDYINKTNLDEKAQPQGGLGHYLIHQSDFPDDPKAFFEFINDNCDLDIDPTFINSIKAIFNDETIDLTTPTGLPSGNTEYFWNESMNKAMARFLEYFDPDNDNSLNAKGRSLTKADAGNSFDSTVEEKWVIPWTKINKETYSDVRGEDKIESVLNNENQLQFTRNKQSDWLRLLMPKYLRKVEVEDLNRNFWVLSAALNVICDTFFSNESPYKQMFEDILNELFQLWENVLYLWAAIAAISQKPEATEIHTEVVPIPNNELQPYVKFDNFGGISGDIKDALIKRFDYMPTLYPDMHLCIVPQIRMNNYKHNYYSKEYYPGLLFYNRAEKNSQWSFVPFQIQGETGGGTGFTIDAEEFLKDPERSEYAAALYDDTFTYKYIYPASAAPLEIEPYYIMMRTEVKIEAVWDTTSKKIKVNTFQVLGYDVSVYLKNESRWKFPLELFKKMNTNSVSDNEQASNKEWESDSEYATVYHDVDLPAYKVSYESRGCVFALQEGKPEELSIEKGFYMGEFPSYCCALITSWEVDVQNKFLVPTASQFTAGGAAKALRECYFNGGDLDNITLDEPDYKFAFGEADTYKDLCSDIDKANVAVSSGKITEDNNSLIEDAAIVSMMLQDDITNKTVFNKLTLYRGAHSFGLWGTTGDNENLVSNDGLVFKTASNDQGLEKTFNYSNGSFNSAEQTTDNRYYFPSPTDITYIKLLKETLSEGQQLDGRYTWHKFNPSNRTWSLPAIPPEAGTYYSYKEVSVKDEKEGIPLYTPLNYSSLAKSYNAVLYNPFNKSTIFYDKYHYTTWYDGYPGSEQYAGTGGAHTFLTQQIYLNTERRIFRDDNWYIITIDLLTTVCDQGQIKADWEKYYSGQMFGGTSNTIIYGLIFSVFRYDGKACQMIYKRKKGEDNGPTNKWEISYDNFGNNDFSYRDFQQIVDGLLRLDTSVNDFQHYPNTGDPSKESKELKESLEWEGTPPWEVVNNG